MMRWADEVLGNTFKINEGTNVLKNWLLTETHVYGREVMYLR